jgi:hypothetical protein
MLKKLAIDAVVLTAIYGTAYIAIDHAIKHSPPSPIAPSKLLIENLERN